MRVVVCLVVLFAACGPTVFHAECTDQTIAAGDLVITEVFPAPTGGDPGKEWFEIYNNGERPIELEGVTLLHGDSTHVMREVVIAPEQYFTLGDTSPDQTLPYVDYGYGSDLGELEDTTGELALRCGTHIIDRASWSGVVTGHSRELTSAAPPDATENDDQASWCEDDATEFADGNFGTPGQDNDCIPLATGQCNDFGNARAVVPPQVGDLVITEVMPNPSKVGDMAGEWFELAVMRDVDLNGTGFDRDGDTAAPEMVTSADCVHVAAGQFLVFAHQDMDNGDLPNVDGTFGFALTNTGGDLRVVTGATTIDEIRWPSAPTGASLQLDPTRTDPIANDDPSNFCASTTPYGLGDLGTPSVENHASASVAPAAKCDDTATPRAIVSPATGQLSITDVMPNPTGDETKREWIEIENVGSASFDLNGLGIDRVDDSRPPDVIQASACHPVGPGGFAVFARSADPTVNGGLPDADATFGFTLVNASGECRMLAADGTTVLDEVTWTTTTDGSSLQRDPTTKMFCAGTTPYGDGTNRGTPRMANLACPP